MDSRAIVRACLGVLLLSSLSTTWAMIEHKSMRFTSDHLFEIIWRFEFAEQGELSLKGQVAIDDVKTNTSVQLMVCSDSSLLKLRTVSVEDVCLVKPFNSAACEWQGMFTEGVNHFDTNFQVKTNDWYYLIQLNCDNLEFDVDLHVVAYNRGKYSGFLSLSEVPYIPVSIVLAVVFAFLGFAHCLTWFPYRYFNVQLQSRLTLVPLLFAVFYTVQIFYWQSCSKNGVKPVSTFWASFCLLLFIKVILFMLLLSVSKGWAICQRHMSNQDFKQSCLLIIGLVLANSCFTILGPMGVSTMILIYAMLLKVIFNSVVVILSEIDSQMQSIRSMDLEPSHFPLYTKRQMYHNFQLTTLSYITMKVVFLLWSNIFLQRFPWVSDLVDAVLDMAFLICLFVNFRMRPFYPSFAYAPISDDDVPENARHLLRSGPADQDVESGAAPPQLWRPGMPLPMVNVDYASWLHPYSEPLIIIDNPTTIDIGSQLPHRANSKGGSR